VLAILPTLAPYRLMLAVALQPRGFDANLPVTVPANRSVTGYIVRGLLDGSLPRRHTSWGTADGTTGLIENRQTIVSVACRSHAGLVRVLPS
jgi:hypothetical protein